MTVIFGKMHIDFHIYFSSRNLRSIVHFCSSPAVIYTFATSMYIHSIASLMRNLVRWYLREELEKVPETCGGPTTHFNRIEAHFFAYLFFFIQWCRVKTELAFVLFIRHDCYRIDNTIESYCNTRAEMRSVLLKFEGPECIFFCLFWPLN